MSDIVIKAENIGKLYKLGEIGTGTISHDLNRWWARVRGKEDPFTKIGQANDRTVKGDNDWVWALQDINFEVKQGEVLGIIGRNGAGKSTLLKILSKVTTPSTGRIKVKGRIASLLEVGTGFHPELTGRENIFLNGAILGMTKAEIKSKFDEIVDFAGVERYIDTPVKRYSSGMYVRLAFAVAAFLEPEILIIDEVLAVGDIEFQNKCMGRMKDVSINDGRTVLFVSHNMAAISNLCNSLCLLDRGGIEYLGDVEEGVNRYMQYSKTKGVEIINRIAAQNSLLKHELFELISIRLLQDDQEGVEFVTNRDVKIKFLYRVEKTIIGLRIGFDIVELKSGITVFRSFHDDRKESKTHESGEFENTATLPANLLISGSYNLKIVIGIHNVGWITNDEISILIQTHNTTGINSQYADNRPGVILPAIDWVSKKNN
ncbi:MAG TPA: polysaccharide ABC transporter ATP-binding protein [Chitinophagaceae bacterium]|jgi:lipopolysaccharide transport system ATP-binding protein|nr:polysaccharide ABC transporter ATP-binding protein [Chitinophagaceae bacterium]HMU59897.1 polysaccharide ABC transporter ATP-binding protein [Chitinophagaceae bacterium]